MDAIVSTSWLNEHLDHPNIIILDATQHQNKDGVISVFEHQYIKNARIFDIKNVFSDTSNAFPNAFPKPLKFETSCQEIGINQTSMIVVYDRLGIFSSPRVWWLFKTMGHQHIAILNGGLPEWIANGYTTVNAPKTRFKKGDFKAILKPDNVRFFNDIKQNCNTENSLVVDVRSSKRFLGLQPESRKGLRSGHIPKSINLPYDQLLTNGQYKPLPELKKIINTTFKTKQPIIFSCGSGITACIVYLACRLVLDNTLSVYDGSWTEWATLEN